MRVYVMVNSEETKEEGILNALKVINVKGKYRILPANIDINIMKVLSIYLYAY
jgi:hypothetical protein